MSLQKLCWKLNAVGATVDDRAECRILLDMSWSFLAGKDTFITSISKYNVLNRYVFSFYFQGLPLVLDFKK